MTHTRRHRLLRAVLPAAGLLACLAGCLTPEKAEKDADETAIALATAYWHEQTGTLNEVRARADAVIAAEWKEG